MVDKRGTVAFTFLIRHGESGQVREREITFKYYFLEDLHYILKAFYERQWDKLGEDVGLEEFDVIVDVRWDMIRADGRDDNRDECVEVSWELNYRGMLFGVNEVL